jgi:hypothetical protein
LTARELARLARKKRLELEDARRFLNARLDLGFRRAAMRSP